MIYCKGELGDIIKKRMSIFIILDIIIFEGDYEIWNKNFNLKNRLKIKILLDLNKN